MFSVESGASSTTSGATAHTEHKFDKRRVVRKEQASAGWNKWGNSGVGFELHIQTIQSL